VEHNVALYLEALFRASGIDGYGSLFLVNGSWRHIVMATSAIFADNKILSYRRETALQGAL